MNTRPADYESAALPTELFQHGLFSFCFLPHGFDGSRRCSSPLPPRTVDAAPSKGPRSFSRGKGSAQKGEIYQRPLVFYHKRQGKVKTYLGAGQQREGKKPGGPLLVWTEPCPRGLFPGEQTEVSFKKNTGCPQGSPRLDIGGMWCGRGAVSPSQLSRPKWRCSPESRAE